jgi:hypothetical protein
MKTAAVLLALAAATALSALGEELRPILAQPNQVLLKEDFGKPGDDVKAHWGPRQGTRWSIADGVLRGQPSTPEYQASRKDHKGLEPRVSCTAMPKEYVIEFSIRFMDGKATVIVPFVEFGHHVCRVYFGKDGAQLLADGESVRLAEAKGFTIESGKWYHAMAELKGDEFVIRFEDGPALHAKHAGFAKPAESGAGGFGVAGLQGGTVELDNVTVWSVKDAEQPGWAAKRAEWPQTEAVQIKAAKASKPRK